MPAGVLTRKRESMTYEDLIVAIDATAPQIGSCALRLLLRLIAIAITQGSNQVRASDRWIGTQLGFSNDGVTAAKRGLKDILGIEAARGSVTTFNLPAEWFTPQRSLFAAETALVNRAPRPGEQGQAALVNGAPMPFLAGRGALMNGAPRPGEQGNYPAEQGGLPRLQGQTALVSRAPTTQNQQDSGALRSNSNSNSVSITTEIGIEIDRVLDTVEISPDRWEEANVLKAHLHTFMQQRGEPAAARKPPSVEMLAKCLSIAPLTELVEVLQAVSKNQKLRPGSYIWFVVVFLDHCRNIPWKATKQRMDERKQRKQPGRAEPLPFPAGLLANAVSQVKKLR